MRTRLLGIPIAGLLLVAGATAVLAGSGAGSAMLTVAGGAGGVLADVLSDLVDDGTITQDQADAITDAVDERREELRAEHEQLREQMQQSREQMRAFLEDGVISADELAQLPEDHPLRNVDEEFLADGQLTTDELREIRGSFRGPGFGRHGGPGMGGGPWHRGGTDDSTPEDTPAEGTST